MDHAVQQRRGYPDAERNESPAGVPAQHEQVNVAWHLARSTWPTGDFLFRVRPSPTLRSSPKNAARTPQTMLSQSGRQHRGARGETRTG